MRRSLVFLFIVLMSVTPAENAAAYSLNVEEVTSDSVTLSWEAVLDAEMYILYRDDGTGWSGMEAIYDAQTSEYRWTGLESSKTYRFKLRYCMDLGCGDDSYSNVVEVTTHPHGDFLADALPVVLAAVLVIVSVVVVALIALRRRGTERD